MHFSELKLSKAIEKAVGVLGHEETTPIQTEAIPPGLAGRDIVGCAQTGTGKTLAFLLPALDHLQRHPAQGKKPRVVILAPTRELTIQVANEINKLVARLSIRSVCVYGGAGMQHQTAKLRRGVDIVVATPGRLMDHMGRGNVDFSNVEILVLDEADRMLDMGFLPDVQRIVRRMPRERQTMLFSATMPPGIAALARQFLQDPVQIEIDLASPPKAIQQTVYPVPRHLKVRLLVSMLNQMDISSMLVFMRTKREANIVTAQLRDAKIRTACIHGDFSQSQRISALEGFRSGKHQVLVATNIAARGLDIEGISHVVNYDVPEHPEDYVHRVGRTARADADGDAITLVSPDDEGPIRRIEKLLGYKIERKMLAGFNYDVPTPSWARSAPRISSYRGTRSKVRGKRRRR